VHRYCAFFDLPVFTAKHCDLKSKRSDHDEKLEEPRQWPVCSCSSFSSLSMSASPDGSSRATPASEDSHGISLATAGIATSFPFSSHQSAKICLKSALNIAHAFDDLPFPNPSGQQCEAPCHLSPTSMIVSPRTMPSFACCAMQCAYALLMVYHKTKSMYPQKGSSNIMVDSLLERLQRGLMSILATLENYATAYEALGGMRGMSFYASPHSRVSRGCGYLAISCD
jgi:hypothetical protein